MNSEPESAPQQATRNSFGNALWWFVMVQAGLLVTLVPVVLVFIWVEGGLIATVAYALAGLLVGPSLQAGMYALRRPEAALRQTAWNRYWEGWRVGGRQSLIIWAPAVVLVAGVQALSQAVPPEAIARPLVIMGFILGGVLTAISITTLTVISTFTFRTRDVPRVALFAMGSKPFAAIGLVLIVAMAGWGVLIGFEAVVVTFAVVVCWGLLAVTRPMHAIIRKKLVADPE